MRQISVIRSVLSRDAIALGQNRGAVWIFLFGIHRREVLLGIRHPGEEDHSHRRRGDASGRPSARDVPLHRNVDGIFSGDGALRVF